MCWFFLCSYKENKLKLLLFCAWFNGQFGESDCLCKNGKCTIKLWVPGGRGSASLSKDWWFLAPLERGRLRGNKIKWMARKRVKFSSRAEERLSSYVHWLKRFITYSGPRIMTRDFGVFYLTTRSALQVEPSRWDGLQGGVCLLRCFNVMSHS